MDAISAESVRTGGRGHTAVTVGAVLLLASGVGAGAADVAVAQSSVRISNDEDAEELVLEVGPLELPANAMHHDVTQPAAQSVAVPLEGWIHGFRVEIVDGAGRPVPKDVLHHVNVIAPGARELFSPIMQRVAAAGKETAAIHLPRFVGYRISRTDSLLVTAMVHNPTDRSWNSVFLRVRMPYTPADTWIDPVDVHPFYVDVMPPASGHAYDLPPGRSERSWEGTPAIAGRILGVGGHLHKYAVALRFEDVTADEVIWRAEPIVDEEGEVVGMPTKNFFWRLGVPIDPDHVYRLTAVYDNPTGRTIERGAMGALGGIVKPADGVEWPAVDPSHPEYRLDVELVTEGAYGDDAHAHGEGHHPRR